MISRIVMSMYIVLTIVMKLVIDSLASETAQEFDQIWKGSKLSPRFMGPFKVVERKGPVAYRLALPDYLSCMHDVFHVYVLRHYVSDPTHVIDMISLQVSKEGALTTEPIRIMDHRIRQIRCAKINQVKVQWDNYSPYSGTWEDAYDMHQHFLVLLHS
jgi:hypothetical protein